MAGCSLLPLPASEWGPAVGAPGAHSCPEAGTLTPTPLQSWVGQKRSSGGIVPINNNEDVGPGCGAHFGSVPRPTHRTDASVEEESVGSVLPRVQLSWRTETKKI